MLQAFIGSIKAYQVLNSGVRGMQNDYRVKVPNWHAAGDKFV